MIRRIATALILALSAPLPSQALEAVECPTEQMRIVLIGDSLADGLAEAVERGLSRCATIDIVTLTAVSEGLVRASVQDWIDRYAGATVSLLETQKTDLVLVQMGVNDIATLRTDAGQANFGTEDWVAGYATVAGDLAERLSERAARVLWLGLPVIGGDARDADYTTIAETQERAATEAGAEYLDIREMSKFGTDGFVRDAEVDGRERQVRSSDQVRFTSLGYDLVAQHLSDAVAQFVFDRDLSVALSVDLLQ